MAAIIKRAGRVILSVLIPILFISIVVYSTYLLKTSKAEPIKDVAAKEDLLKQKPVWTESDVLNRFRTLHQTIYAACSCFSSYISS